MRARAKSKILHSTPLLVLGIDLVDNSCNPCRVPPSDTHMERQRHLEMPRWVWPSGFPSETLMISQNFSDYLQFYYYYYYSQPQNASNASKPVKLRIPHLEHGKKKSQVGKQWVGNGKVEWSPPEITQKKVFLAFASQPEGSYMFLYIVPRGLKTVRSDAKPISVLWNQGQLYKYLLFLIKPNIATSFI